MTALSTERLAEIRARQDSRRRQAEAAHVHAISLGPSHLWSAMQDLEDALAHVDHLTAENARLREGIERVRGHVHESWLTQGDVGLIEDALDDCDALLSPPTEGETDHE